MFKAFSFSISTTLFIASGVFAASAIVVLSQSGTSQAFAGLFFATMFFFVVGKMAK